MGHQEASGLRRFAGVVARKKWCEMVIPFTGKIESALLNPAIKIGWDNAVGSRKTRMVRHSIVTGAVSSVTRSWRDFQIVRRKPRGLQTIGRIVLDDDVATGFDVSENLTNSGQVRAGIESPNANYYRIKAAQWYTSGPYR